MDTWVLIVRNRASQEWTACSQLFASGEECEKFFSQKDYYADCDAARWHDMGWSIRNFHGDCEVGNVIRINEKGAARVLNGKAGMTFEVANVTEGLYGKVAHVLDLRYPQADHVGGYQSWSIARDGYEVIAF